MENEIVFREAMAVFGEIYDKQISEVLLRAYWKIFEPFSDEDCMKAFKRILEESSYFPRPADFMKILATTHKERATIAWLSAVKTVARFGNYTSVQFRDQVIHSVIEAMGGWVNFNMFKESERTWVQKEFERLYEIMEKQGRHPAYLPGTCETINSATGQGQTQEIVKIGFEDKPDTLPAYPEGRIVGMGK
ncbi:MAG: DUF6475 domain-containing protein [Deltaproteobacteria bacterium]|nr:DUF6475 domain-containing protein [Deltaproteobacteria bacterium]